MKLLAVAVIFWLGAAFGRWDALHGYDAGMAAGKWTRQHVFGLPPAEEKKPIFWFDCVTDAECEGVE